MQETNIPDKKTVSNTGQTTSDASSIKMSAYLSEPASILGRLSLRAWSLLIFVAFPIIASAFYLVFVASDRYAATSGFSIRGADSSPSLDGLGTLTGLASAASVTSDSYIIIEYIESLDFLLELDRRVDLRRVYSDPGIDRLSRLKAEASNEEFLKYWKKRNKISFDTTSGIIVLETQSFSANHSKLIAEAATILIQELVNSLSAKARQDALSFADTEVLLAEQNIREAMTKILEFQENEESISPPVTAQLDMQLLSALESRLVDLRARLSAVRNRLDADAPSVVSIRGQIRALEREVAIKRAGLTNSGASGDQGRAVAQQLITYESLQLDKQFAEQQYASALQALEYARREANRQQRYLATFSSPTVAEEPAYPKVIISLLTISLMTFGMWAIGLLLIYSVRDHLS